MWRAKYNFPESLRISVCTVSYACYTTRVVWRRRLDRRRRRYYTHFKVPNAVGCSHDYVAWWGRPSFFSRRRCVQWRDATRRQFRGRILDGKDFHARRNIPPSFIHIHRFANNLSSTMTIIGHLVEPKDEWIIYPVQYEENSPSKFKGKQLG